MPLFLSHSLSLSLSQKEVRGEEVVARALSDRWVYRHKWHDWARKTHHRRHSDGSEGGNLADSSLPTSPNTPLLISELRGSLTDLTREVKTYSFCPGDDQLPPIMVDPPGTTHYASTSSTSPTKPLFPSSLLEGEVEGEVGVRGSEEAAELVSQSTKSIDSETFDPKLEDEGGIDNFALGLCSAFDSNMQKMKISQQKVKPSDQRSCSLPNVFSFGHDIIDTSCVSTTTDENTSTSVSAASMLGDSASGLDEPAINRTSTPERLAKSAASCVNGHDDRHNSSYSRTSSATTLPSSFKITAAGGVVVSTSPAIAASTPKRWSGPASEAVGGYESGSDIRELDREHRSRLSPLVDGWASHSYAHPPRKGSLETTSPTTEGAEPVRRRKKRSGGGSIG